MAYFLEDIIALNLFKVVSEVILEIHIPLDMWLLEHFALRGDAVVGEVDELVADLLGVVVDGWESDVAFIVEPDGQGVEVCDENPLSDIKFATQNH